MSFVFGVITKIDCEPEGNHCDDILIAKPCVIGWGPDGDLIEERYVAMGWDDHITDDSNVLHVRLPVFELGEIVILDSEHGREVAGRGRKPSKWFVECEHFSSLKMAVERAKQVLDAQYAKRYPSPNPDEDKKEKP